MLTKVSMRMKRKKIRSVSRMPTTPQDFYESRFSTGELAQHPIMATDSTTSLSTSAFSERCEFKAGIAWHIQFLLMFAVGILFFFWALLEKGWFRCAFFIFYNLLLIVGLARQAPWSPFYQGPSLIVDSVGVRADKWSATWEEIDKFDTAPSGRKLCVAIYTKNPKAKQPFRVQGPIGDDLLQNVVRYLNARLEASRIELK